MHLQRHFAEVFGQCWVLKGGDGSPDGSKGTVLKLLQRDNDFFARSKGWIHNLWTFDMTRKSRKTGTDETVRYIRPYLFNTVDGIPIVITVQHKSWQDT